MTDATLAVEETADRLQDLLDGTLPCHGTQVSMIETDGPGIELATAGAEGGSGVIQLFAVGEHVGSASVAVRYRWSAPDHALVVRASKMALFLVGDRQPLVRFEYHESMTSTPPSHFHVHAERSAFGAMLARTHGADSGTRKPGRLASLHLPLGGPHFRTGLADFVEFLIEECGVDALPGWRSAVHEYRRDWRRDEAAATARQFPAETADALRALGWTVDAPVVDWEQRFAQAVSA